MPLPNRRSSSSSRSRRTSSGKGLFAAAHDDRREEQVALVDQPGPESLGGEVGAADREVPFRRAFSRRTSSGSNSARAASGRWIPLAASWSTRSCPPPATSPRSPACGAAGRRGRAVSQPDHHLVHPAPVEVGADRPLEVVDEGVHLGVRLGPVEAAVLVGDVPVERGDRRVDQLGHDEPINP